MYIQFKSCVYGVSAKFLVADFNLFSSVADKFMFPLLYWVILYNTNINLQNLFTKFSQFFVRNSEWFLNLFSDESLLLLCLSQLLDFLRNLFTLWLLVLTQAFLVSSGLSQSACKFSRNMRNPTSSWLYHCPHYQ